MKTHHFILKEDGNIYVIHEMPARHDHYHGDVFMPESFDRAIERAKESAILVENQEEVRHASSLNPTVGQLYPLECGIEVKYELYTLTQDRWSGCSEDNYLSAINNGRKAREVALITFSESPQKKEDLEKSCQWNCDNGYCLSWEAKYNERRCNYCTISGVSKPSEEQVERQDCCGKLFSMKCTDCPLTPTNESSPAHTDSQEEPTQEELWEEIFHELCADPGNVMPSLLPIMMNQYTITRKQK